jgi:predicted acylesterase/phospholipase RssA
MMRAFTKRVILTTRRRIVRCCNSRVTCVSFEKTTSSAIVHPYFYTSHQYTTDPSHDSSHKSTSTTRVAMFRNMVLAGGGPYVTCFIGGIQYLEHVGIMGDIKQIVGTSAGALMAFLLVLGMTATDIRRFLIDKFRKDGCNKLDVEQVLSFFHQWGVDDGSRIMKSMKDVLRLYADRDDITFMDLAKLTGKDLVVCVSNLNTQRPEFFCVSRTPHESVLKALRMSMSIPYLFTPVVHADHIYVDGGIFSNYPAEYCARPDATSIDTIGFDICFEKAPPPPANRQQTQTQSQARAQDVPENNNKESIESAATLNFLAYVWQLTMAVISRSNQVSKMSSDTCKNIVKITFDPQTFSASYNPMNFSFEDMAFDLSDMYIERCLQHGYHITKTSLGPLSQVTSS